MPVLWRRRIWEDGVSLSLWARSSPIHQVMPVIHPTPNSRQTRCRPLVFTLINDSVDSTTRTYATRQAVLLLSGNKTLQFKYVVQEGDSSADLDYASTRALSLNGGSRATRVSTVIPPCRIGSPKTAMSIEHRFEIHPSQRCKCIRWRSPPHMMTCTCADYICYAVVP